MKKTGILVRFRAVAFVVKCMYEVVDKINVATSEQNLEYNITHLGTLALKSKPKQTRHDLTLPSLSYHHLT
jgi:hypothetical protein